ncbi:MAG: hypothetical protein AB7F99_17680 [Vicinamibacterales bacterium]
MRARCTGSAATGLCRRLVGRMELIDALVVVTVEDENLRPSGIDAAVVLVLEELKPARLVKRRRALERERAEWNSDATG